MTKNLETDSDYLKLLAERQDYIATDFETAKKTVDKTRSQISNPFEGGIWWDHGVLCYPGITKLGDALDERQPAVENMQNVSEQLRDNLREAAGAYDSTDEQTSGNLDDQMLQG